MAKQRKFRGIKTAVGEMPKYDRGDGMYLQVHYDLYEDRVITDLHVSFGHNSWTEYDDPDVISVGNYDTRVTMAELKEDIWAAIAAHEEMEERRKAQEAYDEWCLEEAHRDWEAQREYDEQCAAEMQNR